MYLVGPARIVLAGERAALDFLMVLSGIATEARRWQAAAGAALSVTDTRKTLPGLRALSKYAVRVGGAANHRFGLFDMVLIKDNHIGHAGGVAAAVRAAAAASPGLLVACEADTLDQAVEAAQAGADLILLDNMDDAELARAAVAVREVSASLGQTCLTEASGGIEFGRLPALARAGVDRASSSAITLAPPVDFALDAD
jgi:nicotinate-nucleotide pyrophosphorylase (carboxylating)